MATDTCTPPPPGAEALERAIAVARADLAALANARRRLRSLTDRWRGGHRERFDAELATLDRRAAQLEETVARAAVALRRALDDAGRP